jgi:hypothetical protein
MMMLIAAAVAAAQPAPAAQPHGELPDMQHEQHEGMKKDCCKDCCKDMGEGKHDMHAPGTPSQRGE